MTEIDALKENLDSHIKELKRKISELEDLPQIVNENASNIQHNYELIYELKDEIEDLKQEINALKLIQILYIKDRQKEFLEQNKELKNDKIANQN